MLDEWHTGVADTTNDARLRAWRRLKLGDPDPRRSPITWDGRRGCFWCAGARMRLLDVVAVQRECRRALGEE
jgi:hypothetical protein